MGRASTIIKAGTLSGAEQANIQPVEMVDLIMEAKGVLARAREDARGVMERARAEAEELRRSAREEGYAQGHEEGLREGRAAGHEEAMNIARAEFERKQRNLTASCRNLIEDINNHRASWQAAARHDLVDLAMAIGTRVAHAVGERERGVVLANLEKAVELAGRRSQITLVIHPEDAETARTFVPSLLGSKPERPYVDVREDEAVSPGGCRLEWETGAVDATLETQLNRIGAELRQERGRVGRPTDVKKLTASDEENHESACDDRTESDT